MKIKLTFKNIFINSFIAIFLLTVSSELMAQKQISSDIKVFKIKIESTDKGLKLQSLRGSSWFDLSFNLSYDKPQAIDEYGMTQLDKVSTEKDDNLADYLFTITKTKNGVKLTGVEGTAWKELNFTLPKNGQQMID
jgi:hypothetical protein